MGWIKPYKNTIKTAIIVKRATIVKWWGYKNIYFLLLVHVSAHDIQQSCESQFTGEKYTDNIRPVIKNKQTNKRAFLQLKPCLVLKNGSWLYM